MASLLSLEDQAAVAEIRAKYANGTVTPDDTKRFIAIMRQGRLSAHAASAASKTKKAKAEIPNADDMLKEFMG